MKFIIVLISSLISINAFAEEPRKIDMATVLNGADGPFKECRKIDDATGKCTEQVDLTLGRLCLNAAGWPDKSVNIVDQISHGRLAMKILETISNPGVKEIALTVDDIKFLKDQSAKLGYNTMIIYQAAKLLDPATDK